MVVTTLAAFAATIAVASEPGTAARGPAAAPAATAGPDLRLVGRLPARTGIDLVVEIPGAPAGPPWSLVAFDVGGRKVRTLVAGASSRAKTHVLWDLTDDAGRRVASGLYFAQLRVGAASRSRMIVVVP